jgi:hypothetical protein
MTIETKITRELNGERIKIGKEEASRGSEHWETMKKPELQGKSFENNRLARQSSPP